MRSLIVRGNFSHQQRDCRRPRRFSAFPPRFSCAPRFSCSSPCSLPLRIVHRAKKSEASILSNFGRALPSLGRSAVRKLRPIERETGVKNERQRERTKCTFQVLSLSSSSSLCFLLFKSGRHEIA